MCKTKEREYRAKIRKELGYRDPKIQAERVISTAKVKAARRCTLKREAQREIRNYVY